MLRSIVFAVSFVFAGQAAFADVERGLSLLEAGDVSGAATAFQEGFEAGEADGAFYLGRLFELGVGTEPDINRAAQLYAAGVAEDSVLAQNRLGGLYLAGEGVPRNYKRAFELICAAADAGEVTAQVNCAALYDEGRGVAADSSKAQEYWHLAADQGSIVATNLLALALRDSGDTAAAYAFFIASAETGNLMGLYESAVLLSDAESGVAQDPALAYQYALLAAGNGYPEAAALRDELENTLDEAAITAAQDAAIAWQPAGDGSQAQK